jgi:hypothetical protein
MTETAKGRPPKPVVAAVLLLLVAFALPVGSVLWSGGLAQVAAVLAGAVGLGLAYALLRGNPMGKWVVILILAANLTGVVAFPGVDLRWVLHMVVPLVIIALLLGPAPSRRWFAASLVGSGPNPDHLGHQVTASKLDGQHKGLRGDENVRR